MSALPPLADVAVLPLGSPHQGEAHVTASTRWAAYAANAAVSGIMIAPVKAVAADGRAPLHVVATLYGANGKPLSGESYVTIELTGDARLPLKGSVDTTLTDLDRATPGTQVKVINGRLAFEVIAPSTPQIASLRITAGLTSATTKLHFNPEVRPLFAVGLLEGVFAKGRVVPGEVNSRDGFSRDLANWSKHFSDGSSVSARAAFFAKGAIAKDTSLTVAYDSDKAENSRLMRDISPEFYYPVTGDASVTGFDARSSGRGYVRLDHGAHYALYGDFNTGDGFSQPTGGGAVADIATRKFGAYNRTLNGVRLHAEGSRYVVNGFASYDRLRQTTEQYALNGTSILPFATRGNAVVGSEKVEIITYDKNVRTVMLSRLPLERYKDYAFEPFNGRIRLIGGDVNFLDSNGNPRFIHVSYETEQATGARTWAYGADAQIRVAPGVEVGGNYVKDVNPLAPYQLYSINGSFRLGPKTVVVAELAHSQSATFTELDGSTSSFSTATPGESKVALNGKAYRVEAVHESKSLKLSAHYEHIDAGFVNPSISITAGQTTFGAKADIKLTTNFSAYADVSRIRDDVSPTHPARNSEEVGVRWGAATRFTVSAALHHLHEDAGLSTQTSLPANYGGLLATNTLTNITNTSPLNALTARLALSYKVTDALTLDAEAEHALRDMQHNRFALGASYQVAERTKIYARYEDQTGLGSGLSLNQGDRSRALVAGVESSYADGATAYSEYRLRNAMSDQSLRVYDMQLASGVRNTWHIAEGLAASTNAEYLKIFNGSAREALGLGAGLDYTASASTKASVRGEWRRIFDDHTAPGDQTETQILLTAALAHKLSPSWTLLARNYLLLNSYREDVAGNPKGNILQDRAQIGAAFRPAGNNRWAALLCYDYKIYRDHSVADGSNYAAHIGSLNVNWHPDRKLTVDARLAGEARTDVVPNSATGGTTKNSFTALLASSRVIYDVTPRFDLSLMAAVTRSSQGHATEYAQGAEAGYLIAKNVWLSAGYNWTGFNTSDLSGSDYHNRGAFLRLRVKFGGDLLGG